MKLPRDQFERLALEQMDLLYRVARKLTRKSEQANDLVQETYLRAIKSYQTFDLQEHGIRPWLVRIMHNLHFSQSDREKKQPVAMEGAPLEALSPAAPTDNFALGGKGFEGMDERLVKALKQLPEEYQTVLLLWAVEDFSYKDIADAVDVPIGTVMSRLYRARQKLTQSLHDLAVEEGVIRK